MAYKMLASTHLNRLCLLLCDCCSVSSSARDLQTGRDFCRLPDLTVDSLNFVGFRAVSLLIRHCAQLLHAPVTEPGALSAMEQLIDNFVLPRQLYDWERLCRQTSSISVEQPLAKSVVECLCDKLTEFTSGLAQLAWRSDAYIARILRDIIRLYYAHLGSECIAAAIVSSPTVDYRAHLLQLSMHEAMNEMNSRYSDQRKSPRQLKQQPVQQRRQALIKVSSTGISVTIIGIQMPHQSAGCRPTAASFYLNRMEFISVVSFIMQPLNTRISYHNLQSP
ncbi:hypothetical protein AHF37_08389 [Paragonimus kellicotti]|nr:hypothetical protein AHF37_08389 [Paragonimus kellicotti]